MATSAASPSRTLVATPPAVAYATATLWPDDPSNCGISFSAACWSAIGNSALISSAQAADDVMIDAEMKASIAIEFLVRKSPRHQHISHRERDDLRFRLQIVE